MSLARITNQAIRKCREAEGVLGRENDALGRLRNQEIQRASARVRFRRWEKDSLYCRRPVDGGALGVTDTHDLITAPVNLIVTGFSADVEALAGGAIDGIDVQAADGAGGWVNILTAPLQPAAIGLFHGVIGAGASVPAGRVIRGVLREAAGKTATVGMELRYNEIRGDSPEVQVLLVPDAEITLIDFRVYAASVSWTTVMDLQVDGVSVLVAPMSIEQAHMGTTRVGSINPSLLRVNAGSTISVRASGAAGIISILDAMLRYYCSANVQV